MARGSTRPKDVMAISRSRNNPSFAQFPEDLGPHSMLMLFKDYRYQKPGTFQRLTERNARAASQTAAAGVLLPIPSNLRDTTNNRIDRFEQQYLGAEASAVTQRLADQLGASGAATTLADLTNIATETAQGVFPLSGEEFYNRVTGLDPSITRSAAFLLRSQLPSAVTRNLDVGFASTPNPKATLAFEGVELKAHSFSWTLAPRSQEESDSLRNISNIIRSRMLPTYGELSPGSSDRAFLNYPNVVDVFLLGVDETHYFRFKTSMLRSFTIDYSSGDSLTFLRGGKPGIVTMAIELMELDIHTAEDYDRFSENRVTVGDSLGPANRGA